MFFFKERNHRNGGAESITSPTGKNLGRRHALGHSDTVKWRRLFYHFYNNNNNNKKRKKNECRPMARQVLRRSFFFFFLYFCLKK